MIIEPFKINETTSVVEVAALIAELNALRTERTALRAECEGLREDAERRAQPRVPEGYVLCKAEPVAWVWTVSSLTTISLIKPTGNTTMGAIPMPLYAPAEQAGGEDEPPTKYYGGPRGGSMSQNAPLAAPTEAEVEAPPMTERYVKASELERLAREWEAIDEIVRGLSDYSDYGITAFQLRKHIAAAQPREPLDVDELAQFIRTTDGNHTMGAGALAESIVGFLAKRHERGEGV